MATVVNQNGLTIETSTTGSGTGNYESFLRLAANGDETGYNTNENQQVQNKDGIWTHDLLISDLQAVNGFYEIRLDLNEIQSGSKPDITLEDLQLFVGDPAGADFVPGFDGRTPVFDLSGSVLLHDTNHGSGTDDYKLLIPVNMLSGGDYLTLYAQFSGSDDGFEEFRALTNENVFNPQPDIGILKTTNNVDDDCPDVLVGGNVTWRYTVENNGNVDLMNVVVTDDNGTPGDTGDDFNPAMVFGADLVHNIGDVNNNNILETTETWQYIETGTALDTHYVNIATVSGVYDDGTLTGQTVTGVEEDCYDGANPSIAVEKLTNGHDDECNYIIVGDAVTWTYNVTNTSDAGITIDTIVLTDDAGTPLLIGDDFHPDMVLGADLTHNIGDTHNLGILDGDETWQYTFTAPAGAVEGEYFNTVTVNSTAHDAYGNSVSVGNTGDDCYFGAAPDIDVIKKTNGTNDLCPVVHVGDAVTWTYFVENTGNVILDNLAIRDDGGSADPDLTGDFVPDAVLKDATHNAGDTNSDGLFDPGEVWQFSATGIAQDGHYDNFAYVSADFTDDFGHNLPVEASEDDCYVGVEGPGVRTPGFWSNPRNGGQFWDGNYGNENHAGEDCFAFGDLLRADTNGNHVLDAGDAQVPIKQGTTPGLLIGDWDLNGVQNGTEDTLFISLDAAKLLINASQKDQQDGRWVVGRDLVATWLNYLAGNPIGEIDGDANYDPKEAIRDAIDYLQVYGDNTNHDGILATANGKSILWEGAASVVKQGTANWTNIGSPIHGALDEYNNTGEIDGIGYAHTCDTDQFVALMSGFSVHNDLFVM